MVQSNIYFASILKPVMLQLRFVGGYSLLGLVGWSLISFVMDIMATAKRMHQIPCTKCRFFHGGLSPKMYGKSSCCQYRRSNRLLRSPGNIVQVNSYCYGYTMSRAILYLLTAWHLLPILAPSLF